MLPPQSSAQKSRQADFFDAEAEPEFEVTRPHGAPVYHAWLLGQKFGRSIAGLEDLLPGASALTVCGGSGMDAEFLARRGARPIVSDISFGAAQRVRARARRFGVELTPVVADVERLPFADRAIDLVYVHDGLHHLEHPHAGLAEMLRVARRAVSITEPARAAATAVAVKAGIALEEEDAGNRVARLTLSELREGLLAHGFEVVSGGRYVMYYGHEPGAPARLLSRRALFSLGKAGWRALNSVLGRFGNKLAVVGVRR
jgi:SAM-dependent methyltransferase